MRDHSESTIRKQKEFTRVYNKGKSRGSRFAVILYRKNNLGYSRTAYVASKKVGNSVQRNRARRLMREAFRAFGSRVEDGYDIIFVARNTINGHKEAEVEASMFDAVRACGLITSGSSRKNRKMSGNDIK